MSQAEARDRLDPEQLRNGLANQCFGHRLVVLEETTSTNDVVLQMAEDEAEGLVVFAEHQTAGRGRYGNRWESSAGLGLCFSILLRPDISAVDSPRLTDWAARTVATTISEHNSLDATVKPPNDVYVGSRKIAGVLLELRSDAGGAQIGILGLGINVNQTLEDFPEQLRERAGSIRIATGAPVARAEFALALLRNLDRSYRAALAS